MYETGVKVDETAIMEFVLQIYASKILVGGFNTFEKYARQMGSFPQVGVKTKNIWNHHPVNV